ncbi:polysaccharide deacetylase family protein [Paenibacillus alvei]|nr:polysaccharide deacetylase family protein [Paenibacillus alvei]
MQHCRICLSVLSLCLLCITGCFHRSQEATPPIPNLPPIKPNQSELIHSSADSLWRQDRTHPVPRIFKVDSVTMHSPHAKEKQENTASSEHIEMPKFTITAEQGERDNQKSQKKRLESQQAEPESGQQKQRSSTSTERKYMWQKSSPSQSAAQASQSSRSSMHKMKKQHLTIAELRLKYPHIFKLNAKQRQGERQVALTFDDAPDNRITPLVLDILKEHNIRATFFLVGSRAKAYPGLVERMVREGHVIGNHSYNHPLLTKLTLPAFEHQVKDTERIIEQSTGYKPRYFRPPYGEINEEQLRWAGDNGYMVVNWDVDTNDWRGLTASRILQNVMRGVRPGSIILQHASGSTQNGYLHGTVKALPSIIQQLREREYEFVTLPDLLQDQKEKKE